MKLVVFSLSLLALTTLVAGELTQEYIDESFRFFKNRFSRVYHSSQEEVTRKNIFVENLQFISDSNKLYFSGHRQFQVGINNFADYSDEEFRQFYLSRPVRANQPFPVGIEVHRVSSNDEQGDGSLWSLLTPVKNQGNSCASGWAFAATASLETALAMKNSWNRLTSLSEQNLIDCSMAQGNAGCAFGTAENAFEYVLANHGIDTEKAYSYEGKTGQCRFKRANSTAALSRYAFVEPKDNALADAVNKMGPVAVMIDAAPKSFRFYQNGVYDDDQCNGELLTHGMSLTGFDLDNWHLRNSFGVEWGELGTMRMTRAKGNICGILSRATYPILEPKSAVQQVFMQ